jgi:hypothetical protein
MSGLITPTIRIAMRCAPAVCAVAMLFAVSAAEAKPRGVVDVPSYLRPTKAALIACQMGPNFLGAAYRGKRYRPYTRTGRPRICVTEALTAQHIL